MEQGASPQEVVERKQGGKDVQQTRLATKRECSLLANYLNEKYGHGIKGRLVESNLAKWSREQLVYSLKAA
jgi:hypothetical protein